MGVITPFITSRGPSYNGFPTKKCNNLGGDWNPGWGYVPPNSQVSFPGSAVFW